MSVMIACLVGKDGKVYAKDGIHSHSGIAKALSINEDKFLRYEYKLRVRVLSQDFAMDSAPFHAKKSHDDAAQTFFDECAATPEKLIAFVQRGNFDEDLLYSLLIPSAQQKYDDATAVAQKEYDIALTSAQKVCDEAAESAWKEYDSKATAIALKSRSKFIASAQKICDEARAAAWKKYDESMASARKVYQDVTTSAWAELFRNPENRIEVWKK